MNGSEFSGDRCCNGSCGKQLYDSLRAAGQHKAQVQLDHATVIEPLQVTADQCSLGKLPTGSRTYWHNVCLLRSGSEEGAVR